MLSSDNFGALAGGAAGTLQHFSTLNGGPGGAPFSTLNGGPGGALFAQKQDRHVYTAISNSTSKISKNNTFSLDAGAI